MKNKFALFTLLGIFLLGTYTVFAQDNQDTIITEEVVAEEVITEAEETTYGYPIQENIELDTAVIDIRIYVKVSINNISDEFLDTSLFIQNKRIISPYIIIGIANESERKRLIVVPRTQIFLNLLISLFLSELTKGIRNSITLEVN